MLFLVLMRDFHLFHLFNTTFEVFILIYNVSLK